MTIWRVHYEDTDARSAAHMEDWPTEHAAKVRERTLREAGLTRVVIYAATGDGPAACWCAKHGPGIGTREIA